MEKNEKKEQYNSALPKSDKIARDSIPLTNGEKQAHCGNLPFDGEEKAQDSSALFNGQRRETPHANAVRKQELKAQNSSPLITCENLEARYGSHIAVQGVSFALNKGDYLCIVGENGSGKSTLMKAVLGLLPPSQGKVSFLGIERNAVGYLPQQSPAQRDFPASVQEVVLSGCLNRRGLLPFYSKKEKLRAAQKMEQLEITSLAKKPYSELSGGQQQRVLLARALCATERLILLDEPTSGLDPEATASFYAVLRRLNADGVAIMMITHDISGLRDHAKNVLHLATQPLFYGSFMEYQRSPAGQKMMGGRVNV